jgi:hypothetical protein
LNGIIGSGNFRNDKGTTGEIVMRELRKLDNYGQTFFTFHRIIPQ